VRPMVVHCKHSPHDVYIGRGGAAHIWGNPFSHLPQSAANSDHVCVSRAEAIEKYEAWLLDQPDLVARAREELRGKVLGCWCSPRACHGHVLARVANDWPTPDLSGVVVFDIESDARETPRVHTLGVQDLVCMAYSIGKDRVSLVDANKAIDLWLDWMVDDSTRFLLHAGYSDMAVMAQAAYRQREGKDCDPGEGWAYELVFRAYESGRVIDTEIRQRLTQIAFGPNKGSAQLGAIVKRTYEVDLSDEKRVPDEAQGLLAAGTPWEQWPADLFDSTPWRVKYGALRDRPIHTWPVEAAEYPKGDVVWPRRIYSNQHDRWNGRPIPDEHRQTLASWDLHILSRPGWRADWQRAREIRELYRGAREHCRRHLLTYGLIKQRVVHAGKSEERIEETASTDVVKQLIVERLGDETPLSKGGRQWWPEAEQLGQRVMLGDEVAVSSLAEHLSKRKLAALGIDTKDPFAKLGPVTVSHALLGAVRFEASARDAAAKRKAIITEGAKVLDIVDAIDKARQGPEAFDTWLADSGSPALNASALDQKAKTYITNFLDRLAVDRRVRTTYQTLVDTGRVSSRRINIQQMPRDSDKPPELSIRGCITPDPGWVLLVADYSQLELCALAHILSVMVRRRTGDPTYESSLARAINAGKDCHVLMASTLLSMTYEECAAIRKRAEAKKEHKEPLDREERLVLEHRQIGKAGNFGFPGGQGPKTYIEYAAGYNLTLTLDQATHARTAYMETWPEMAEYFEMMGLACKRGEGRTMIRQLYSGRLRGDCYFTRACNSLFQGLAADGAKEALHRIIYAAYRDPASPLYGTRPSGFVHDEFLVSCRVAQAERALPELERHMVEGMRVFIPDVRIEAPGRIMEERWSK